MDFFDFAAMLQGMMRNWKKYGPGYNLPIVYLEVVHRSEKDIKYVLDRAEMIKGLLDVDEPPPCEYAWQAEIDKKGNKTWPKGYCPFLSLCRDLTLEVPDAVSAEAD